MRGVALTQRKGGSGKTALSHALALGASWDNVPAYLMHTDNREPLKVNGRPYMYYDAREPETLQTLVNAAINTDGLCIIDSAGNRPEFDAWIARYVDLVLIPVMPDQEDVKEALVQMDVLESQGAQNVRYLINNFPSSTMERQYVGRYLSQIPLEKTMGWVGSVKAIRTLRENDEPTFQTPPSRVNNLSRSLYRQVRDAFNHQHLRADKTLEIAVGGIQRPSPTR